MIISPVAQLQVTWEKLPDDYVLPSEPVDNINQPPLAAGLSEPFSWSMARNQRKPNWVLVALVG